MRIIETVGAIDIEAVAGGVNIEQVSTDGERDHIVFIPSALVDAVCKAMRTSCADVCVSGE